MRIFFQSLILNGVKIMSMELTEAKIKFKSRKKMPKQVRFNDKVFQAVFDKSKGSKRCIDNVESCPLAEKDEVSEQEKSLHDYHVNKRKRSRLHLRHNILERMEESGIPSISSPCHLRAIV